MKHWSQKMPEHGNCPSFPISIFVLQNRQIRNEIIINFIFIWIISIYFIRSDSEYIRKNWSTEEKIKLRQGELVWWSCSVKIRHVTLRTWIPSRALVSSRPCPWMMDAPLSHSIVVWRWRWFSSIFSFSLDVRRNQLMTFW